MAATQGGAELGLSSGPGNYANRISLDDDDGDDTITTTRATDYQSQGLLESYRRSNGSSMDLAAPVQSPSRSNDEALTQPSLLITDTTTTLNHNSLTYFNCLSLVLGMQIGSGIFSAPAVVSNHVPTPLGGILVWAFAAMLIWTGASCFIELGTTIPLNGGMQEYLRVGYGDFAGFLFSCVWLSIVRPCTIAMIAIVFAEHINGIVLPALGLPEGWFVNKAMALLGVWGTTAVNCLGIKTGAKVAGWFLVLKLLIILSIIGAGAVVGIREKGGHLFGNNEGSQAMRKIRDIEESKSGVWRVFGEYATSAFAALWVMGGWDAVGFVVGEMKDPVRDLPRVLNSAMLIVATGFTLTVTALYIVLPLSIVREKDTPVVTFGDTLYGHAGFIIYTVAISLSALGSINSNVFAIGRLVVAASQRSYIPHYFAGSDCKRRNTVEEEGWLQVTIQERWPRWIARCFTEFARATRRLRLEKGVPIYAMLLTALLTSVYILSGTFRGLIVFIGITEYIIYILTVLALFRLRLHPPPPPLPQPSSPPSIKHASATIHRTNTMNPILFCVISVVLVGRGLVAEPAQAGAIVAVVVVVSGLWLLRQRWV